MASRRRLCPTGTVLKRLAPFALAALALVLYVRSTAPTVLWGDDAFFQRSAFDGTLPADGGGHWLWLTIARAFVGLPLGEAAYEANLVSAIAGAATIVGFFLACRALGLSTVGSTVAALSLAVAHTFWMHCVRAEVYTVFTALLALELALLFRWGAGRIWPLYAALGLFGLTLLGHQMAVLLLPAIGYLIVRRRRLLTWRRMACAAAAFAAGLLPALLILRWQMDTPSLLRALELYFTHAGVDFGPVLFDYSLPSFPRDAALWLAYLTLQFPGPALALAIVALADCRAWIGIDAWQAVIVFYATGVVFAFSYHVNDQYVFYLPSFIAFAFLVGKGWETAARLWSRLRRPVLVAAACALITICPVLAYRGLAGLLNSLDANPLAIRELPGREPNTYFLWPPKSGDWGAHIYGTGLLEGLPADSVVLADYTPYETLKYLQVVEGLRPDVHLVKIEPGDDLAALCASFGSAVPLYLADDDPRYYNLGSPPQIALMKRGMAYQVVQGQ